MTAVVATRCVGQRAPMLSYGCGALICDFCIGQRDVGQRVTLMSQRRDAHIRDRNVGHQNAESEGLY